jgi:hypothetical protein
LYPLTGLLTCQKKGVGGWTGCAGGAKISR